MSLMNHRYHGSPQVSPSALRGKAVPKTFGDAHFSTPDEMRELLVKPTGRDASPAVGFIVDLQSGSDRLIPIYPPAGAKLVSAAPGSGKTASVIAMCNLTFPGPTITIDGKGQSYYVAAGARKRKFGRNAILLTTEGTTHCFNPLMTIRADLNDPEGGEDEEKDSEILARLLAAAIMGDNAVFEDWAIEIVKAVMLYVRTAKLWKGLSGGKTPENPAMYAGEVRERSMSEVARLLMLDATGRKVLAHRMMQSSRRLVRDGGSMLKDASVGDGKLSMNIAMFARKNLAIFGSREVRRMTYKATSDQPGAEPASDDFDMANFRSENNDIYVCFPLRHTARYAPGLRLLIGTMIEVLNRSGGPNDGPGVNLHIDEFPQLKSMSVIADWILFLRSARIYPWFYVQDPASLKRNYPESWSTFEAVTTKIVFGINDIETAKHWSQYLGNQTVENRSYGRNGSVTHTVGDTWNNASGGYRGSEDSGSNWNNATGGSESLSLTGGIAENLGYIGRPLMAPDELLRMGKHEMLMLVPGTRPVRGYLIPYFMFPDLKKLSEDNPPPIRLPFEDLIEK